MIVWPQSLQGRVVLVVLVATFVALVVAMAALALYDARAYRQALTADLSTQAEILAHTNAPALAFDDPQAARENLALMHDRPGVLAAAIYKPSGDLFASYSRLLAGQPGYNTLSYISSHDTELFDRQRLDLAGAALLLAPGGVQIFYGDESARAAGPAPESDLQQATRSDMNWNSIDPALLAHWRKLGNFRARHVALARGVHEMLADTPYVFSRVDAASGDRVVIAWNVSGSQQLPVGSVFAEGERLRDAYSGQTAAVRNGRVTIEAQRWVLLERQPP
jgi:glycosidase